MSRAFRKPDWAVEGRNWPNRQSSRFVRAHGLLWHVQVMGDGPVMLLLHGSGAATHSWRDLAPRLARSFTVIAPDLPGHGFTGTPPAAGFTVPGVARGVAALLAALEIRPELIVGHSAGAAVALRLALDQPSPPSGVIGLNSALSPYWRIGGQILPALTRAVFLNPLVIATFARRAARDGSVDRLIAGTGSTLDAAGLAHYAALLRTPGHVAGVLGMMAHWDLHDLVADLPRLSAPLLLLAGQADRTVQPAVSRRAAALVPRAEARVLPGLGHLMHEEDPALLERLIRIQASTWTGGDAQAGRDADGNLLVL